MQTLLLADDSVTIQRVIELTFADEDINVVAVSDGDQAIGRLDTVPPDIVLVDVGMPGKSGYDVASYVKQTPRLSHIPVVLLTGAFEPVDETKASAIGCDGVLSKPFEPQIVIAKVKELLSRQPGDLAAPAPAAGSVNTPSLAVEAPAVAALEEAVAVAGNDAAAKLDEYFDQLDSAFARFTNPGAPELPLQAAPLPSGLQLPDSADLVQQVHALEPPMIDNGGVRLSPSSELGWNATALAEAGQPAVQVQAHTEIPTPDIPAPAVEAQPAAYRQAVAATRDVVEPRELLAAAVAAPMVAVPSVPRDLPPLSEAFAAILAAEQGDPSAAAWPPPAPAAAAAPAITDEVIDRVSKRVIEQLTDRVVREAVAEAVAGVAERLVREEIERIKSAIKD